ncbi:MAG: hypothetical protein LBE02_04905 [Spirochaetaceae bacterium]|jgi:hypothetical protein|nr:hypothetical protein [Spirochaetaceae bacterium]
MKKVICVAVILAAGFATLSAQTGVIVGVKQGLGMSFSRLTQDAEDTLKSIFPRVDQESQLGLTLGAYGGYGINGRLAILTGLDFYTQGIDLDFLDYHGSIFYISADIPVLLRVTLLQRRVFFGFQTGAHVSFPLYAELEIKNITEDFDAEGVTVGVLGGLFLGVSLGRGRIVGDLRFLFDTIPLKDTDEEKILYRRGLVFTVGYEYSFGSS